MSLSLSITEKAGLFLKFVYMYLVMLRNRSHISSQDLLFLFLTVNRLRFLFLLCFDGDGELCIRSCIAVNGLVLARYRNDLDGFNRPLFYSLSNALKLKKPTRTLAL